MTYLLRKIQATIAVLLIASIGYVYADKDDFSSCEETESCFPCQPICWGQGSINIDLLYWRSFNSGLNICAPTEICERVTSDGKIVSKFRGKGRNPNFKWNPGFRVGVGYTLACNDLDIAASWVHFNSRAHGSKHQGSGLRWNIHFDAIDIIAGYKPELCSCFILRPFGGLRIAKIDQKSHVNNSCGSISCFAGNDLIAMNAHNKEKFSGAGPLLGLEAVMDIFCDFSLYGSISASCLYGKFDVLLSSYSEFVDAVNCCNVRKRLDASLFATDATIGISWQKCICNTMQLVLKMGLENHRYFNYNRSGDYGDLSFDGVNFSAGIAF